MASAASSVVPVAFRNLIAMAFRKTNVPSGRSPYPERGDEKLNSLDLALTQLFARVSSKFERHAARLSSQASLVDDYAPLFATSSDEDLTHAAQQMRGPLLRHGFRPDLTAQGLALVSEAIWRKSKLRPHRVQLLGAMALLEGRFIEMETGEGKTLTGALAAATAALAGKPVHVITVNDYLAARDAEELRPVYEVLGLTVGVIQHGQDAATRRAAYACDVAYAVNKELAFDYLRDGLALGSHRSYAHKVIGQLSAGETTPPLLLRGLWFAIVDEADSILIDEARTPLIISGIESDPDQTAMYSSALNFARQLQPVTDFVISSNDRSVKITPPGLTKLKRLVDGFGGIWRARAAREDLVTHALSALHLYQRDQQYVVLDGKIQIIDEFTGRIAEGRSWQHGLHQIIEAKEQCEITHRHQTQASITYQRFFRRYIHLSGMSGTLAEVAPELRVVYGTPVARIPTNRPSLRTSRGIRLFPTAKQKWRAVVETVVYHQRLQRPILIGTRSIATSELLSGMLAAEHIEHVVLNAHHDRDEAAIIAQAGEPGRVTVATNMAGRGTDIKLGSGVAALGGLHVILTEFHEAARIDRQLIGRGGRQGDPGTYEVIASLEDELICMFARRLKNFVSRSLANDDAPLPRHLVGVVRWQAQSRAQRLHSRTRRQTLRNQDQRDKALAFAKPE
ncbi:preprotein translocase subunit SecA [Bradyrhizobium sp. AZCC 2289]|uniref:preprotein translocase subunit SecA n=1 Tax=Bradyrhizobium sp. AZCC 2289 TaxID=3117026 RepID=UPI002FF3E7F5